MDDKILKKASKELLKSLSERVEKFANLEHVSFLQDQLLP